MVKHHKTSSGKSRSTRDPVPVSIAPPTDAPPVVTRYGTFDLEAPILPDWVDKRALSSGGYPYKEALDDKNYLDDLHLLQIELVKLQEHVTATGRRIVALFEGRDAAGKGGTIQTMTAYMNPRTAAHVALPKPTERERGQWYFQRYAEYLPASGEIILFDRSWYNRAGVEPVMGFCTSKETEAFLMQAPAFERMLVDDGIILFKFWLAIGREMQFKRFYERRHNPLKVWKLSPIDFAALQEWDAYTAACDAMMDATHRGKTPWTVVLANDKRRARLAIIRHVLDAFDYPDKNTALVGKRDKRVIGGPRLLAV